MAALSLPCRREQRLQAAADFFRVGQITLPRRLQPILALSEQAPLRRPVPEQISLIRHAPLPTASTPTPVIVA